MTRNLFGPKTFLLQNVTLPQIFLWSKISFRPTLFFNPKFILTQHFSLAQNLADPNFFFGGGGNTPFLSISTPPKPYIHPSFGSSLKGRYSPTTFRPCLPRVLLALRLESIDILIKGAVLYVCELSLFLLVVSD